MYRSRFSQVLSRGASRNFTPSTSTSAEPLTSLTRSALRDAISRKLGASSNQCALPSAKSNEASQRLGLFEEIGEAYFFATIGAAVDAYAASHMADVIAKKPLKPFSSGRPEATPPVGASCSRRVEFAPGIRRPRVPALARERAGTAARDACGDGARGGSQPGRAPFCDPCCPPRCRTPRPRPRPPLHRLRRVRA